MRLLIPLFATCEVVLALVAPPHALAAGNRYAFLSSVIARDRQRYGVPGIAMVVVHDSSIVFARGSGYADMATHTPVSPTRTVFHLANTSAALTTIAALQLVSKGKLALSANVNRYLHGWQVAPSFPNPVTLSELLANTAGFQDRHIYRRALRSSSLQPLGPYLAARMPPRVQPPGLAYSYSAYSYALAGLIMQHVTHKPFAAAVARLLFRPLGMTHSSFAQRLPQRIASHLAVGYDQSGAARIPAPREYFNIPPAEGMVATATDVSHILEALLDGGRYRDRSVFPGSLTRTLEHQRYTAYPHIPGYPPMPSVTCGFGRYEQNGRVLIEHSGAVRGFSSLLALLPAVHLGYFIAGNIADSSYLFDIQTRLLNRLYPARYPRLHPALQPGSAARFTGTYWLDGYPRTTIEKLSQLAGQIQVTAAGKNELNVRQSGASTIHLTQVAPMLFQQISKHSVSYWTFQTSNGTRMATGGDTIYDRVPWYDARTVQLSFVGALILIFLSAVIIWLMRPIVTAARSGFAGLLAGVTCALLLIFIVSLALALSSAESTSAQHYSWLEYQPPDWVYAVLTLPYVTTGLTVIFLPAVAMASYQSRYSVAGLVHLSLIAVATLAFIPFLLYWNLLGYRF